MKLCGLALAALVAMPSLGAEIAFLELESTPTEQPEPFGWLFGSDTPTLIDLVQGIEAIADDDDVDGLVIRIKDAPLSTTQVQEIGAALSTIRDAGKKVHLYAENYGGSEILLGSFCDERIMQIGGAMSFPGVYMEEMFLADTLEWIGVKAQLIQIGDYKGANETMTRSTPSPAWDKNISGLLDGIYASMRTQIENGYGFDSTGFDNAMDKAWFASAESAKSVGLVDSVLDLPDLEDHLAEMYGDEITWTDLDLSLNESEIDMSNPFAIFQLLSAEPEKGAKEPSIAILHVEGVIVDGESKSGGMTGSKSTGSRTIRRAIEEIIEDDLIEGVIVRVNSPGGSAIASEVIWQGLRRMAKHKPVWISVGNMAASGGYYTAVGGEKIYMNPSSIIGSIGVVGGKYAMGGLYDKLKIHVVGRARGPHADLFASDQPWTAPQRQLVADRMVETYNLFTNRVTGGRSGIDLDQTAEGRLFVAEQAIKLNMADKVGGLNKALGDMAADLDLGDDYGIMHFPGSMTFEDFLEDTLGGIIKAPNTQLSAPLAALRELMGEQRWLAVRDSLAAMAILRDEPVVLTMPRVILFPN